MAGANGQSLTRPTKKCKKCRIIPVTGLRCVRCEMVMHPGCVEYYTDIEKLSDSEIICCKQKPISKPSSSESTVNESENNLESDERETNLDDSSTTVVDVKASNHHEEIREVLKENFYLKNENLLLKKLISEMDDKNTLLLYKISVLEKDGNNAACRNAPNPTEHRVDALRNNENHNHAEPPMYTRRRPENIDIDSRDHSQTGTCTDKLVVDSLMPPDGTTAKSDTTTRNNDVENKHKQISLNQVKAAVKSAEQLLSEQKLKKIIGSNKDNSDLAAKAMNWIFVSNYASTYKEADLIAYLENKFPGRRFVVNAVKNWGTYNSFKVAVEADLIQNIYSANLWPQGIVVTEYKFKNRSLPSTGDPPQHFFRSPKRPQYTGADSRKSYDHSSGRSHNQPQRQRYRSKHRPFDGQGKSR